MIVYKRVALLSLLVGLCGCGQLVEFGDEDDSGTVADAEAGTGGKGGRGGTGGRGGRGGNGGRGGTGGTAGDDVDSGSDDSGAELDGSMGGNGGSPADTVRPTVLSTDPDTNASGVSVTTNVRVTFSENMDAASVIAAYTLMDGLNTVPGVVTVVGDTATFDPTGTLDDATVYMAVVSTAATDLAGNALASSSSWTFTTGDSTRPLVESTLPASDATGVSVNATVSTTFSEDMNTASVVAAFTLMDGLVPIPGMTTVVGDTATFTPDDPLSDDTLYMARFSTAATDVAGNALANDYNWSFRTLLNSPPTVSSTTPAPGAMGVALNTSVTAVFSEDMAPGSIVGAFTLNDGPTPVLGVVMLVGNTATFTPDDPLDEGTVYTASISTGVTDLAGLALASANTWMFTTIDLARPTVESTAPAIGATGVPTSTMVSATFSESMAPAATMGAFTLLDGLVPVLGVVTVVGDTLTFVPDNPLDEDTLYSAVISIAATDVAGNALLAPFPWTFTTGDETDPLVLNTNPSDMDLQVALNKTITATFDEDLDGSTVTSSTFTLNGPGPGPSTVNGMVGYTALGRVASFNPDSDLQMNTLYTARITTSVEDAAGNSLVQDEVWSFTTGTTPAQTVMQLQVPLGAVGPFSILAASGISDIPTSMITGDIGLSPAGAASITGFSSPASCPEILDTLYVVGPGGPACAMQNPALLDSAKLAAIAAYGNATAVVRGTPASISGDLNGLTLYPGLYESITTIEISPGGFLYLDAQGDSTAVFIIRSAGTITTEATSKVVLTKGAKASNIYWTAGSAITLGTGSEMSGTMIASTAISLLSGATLEGRIVTQGPAATAVTLAANQITLPLP
jgi:hypothetical protein